MVNKALSINGLVTDDDFPATDFEQVHATANALSKKNNLVYSQFAAAWNAVSYRFAAVSEYEKRLANLGEGRADPITRSAEETNLFGFFSNGFAVFEATFYGAFALGAFLNSATFPITTAKDQQRISPATTMDAYKKTFSGDAINDVMYAVTTDSAYLEWREVRNILTHRAAPGRTMHIGFGDDQIPDKWKLKDITLDSRMAPQRRKELARLLANFMRGISAFTTARF